MGNLPSDADNWSAAQKVAYLEREAALCDRDATSPKEWPHHRAYAAKVAAEIRAEIRELKNAITKVEPAP